MRITIRVMDESRVLGARVVEVEPGQTHLTTTFQTHRFGTIRKVEMEFPDEGGRLVTLVESPLIGQPVTVLENVTVDTPLLWPGTKWKP